MNKSILRKHIRICKKCFKDHKYIYNDNPAYVEYHKNLINKYDKVLYTCYHGLFILKQNLNEIDEKFEGDKPVSRYGYVIIIPKCIIKKMNESIDIKIEKTCPYYLEHEMINLSIIERN